MSLARAVITGWDSGKRNHLGARPIDTKNGPPAAPSSRHHSGWWLVKDYSSKAIFPRPFRGDLAGSCQFQPEKPALAA